ncbi:hypothetical protein GGI19_005024 [Coemansia pectinata]|uniref:Uncharacterized protein n=1 Tax=Coemansia pectinata TaxID=1052879 RepID=A0A9W8L9Q6_9FUNG|nr:hypothetical protein GGI19_005024 [Coemansia pectinata]
MPPFRSLTLTVAPLPVGSLSAGILSVGAMLASSLSVGAILARGQQEKAPRRTISVRASTFPRNTPALATALSSGCTLPVRVQLEVASLTPPHRNMRGLALSTLISLPTRTTEATTVMTKKLNSHFWVMERRRLLGPPETEYASTVESMFRALVNAIIMNAGDRDIGPTLRSLTEMSDADIVDLHRGAYAANEVAYIAFPDEPAADGSYDPVALDYGQAPDAADEEYNPDAPGY